MFRAGRAGFTLWTVYVCARAKSRYKANTVHMLVPALPALRAFRGSVHEQFANLCKVLPTPWKKGQRRRDGEAIHPPPIIEDRKTMNAPNTRTLPPWQPAPRICSRCRSDLPPDRYMCGEVELRTARQDDPALAIKVLGTVCRFCGDLA